jgi:hypothetical protein
MSFDKVLENYRRMSFSERDKGNRFERLMTQSVQPEFVSALICFHFSILKLFPMALFILPVEASKKNEIILARLITQVAGFGLPKVPIAGLF